MINVIVITPEGISYSSQAESVSLPTTEGEITVLTGHIPIVTTLHPGMMTVRSSGEEQYFAVARGVVEVTGSSVRVLSDIADRVDSLDEQAVEQAKRRAEELLASKRTDDEGFAEATAVLDREFARLRSVRRRKSSRRSL